MVNGEVKLKATMQSLLNRMMNNESVFVNVGKDKTKIESKVKSINSDYTIVLLNGFVVNAEEIELK